MEITNWNYDKFDFSNYSTPIIDTKESPLANAVNVCNHLLANEISHNPGRILEVGCGAYSFLRDSINQKELWEGIDVYEYDSRGRKCIATRIGSVHDIPFKSETFEYVLSNQSIEHWFEYGVSIRAGINEITRVLKPGGKLYINFPMYLHGHPLFVKGDINKIIECISNNYLSVKKMTAYYDKRLPNYIGWKKCGFPDFYVQSLHQNIKSSFVVEAILIKGAHHLKVNKNNLLTKRDNSSPLSSFKRLSGFQRSIAHGYRYFFWKTINKFIYLFKKNKDG